MSEPNNKGLPENDGENRDENLTARLYKGYIPIVYGVCIKYLGDGEAATEAVIDIYGRFKCRLDSDPALYGKEGELIYELAKEVAAEKAAGKGLGLYRQSEVFTDAAAVSVTMFGEGEGELVSLFENYSQQLTKPQRESIRHFFMERKSYREIAELTGYLTSDIRNYIVCGLRTLLAKRGDEAAINT